MCDFVDEVSQQVRSRLPLALNRVRAGFRTFLAHAQCNAQQPVG